MDIRSISHAWSLKVPHKYADVIKRYRVLAKLYHPDRGGDAVVMQRINNEKEFLDKFHNDPTPNWLLRRFVDDDLRRTSQPPSSSTVYPTFRPSSFTSRPLTSRERSDNAAAHAAAQNYRLLQRTNAARIAADRLRSIRRAEEIAASRFPKHK